MTGNNGESVFDKVKAAYIGYLIDEADRDGEPHIYAEAMESLKTPLELIDYLCYELHEDVEDAMKELYDIMAGLISH